MSAARRAPLDNLVRIWAQPEAIELRSGSSGDGNTMVGHFAVFNSWTEIASMFEGNFLERIAPGAFTDTFDTRRGQIRVLYDHGADPQIGNKPLGTPNTLREDKTGAYYEVDLFDASYVNDLKPALRGGQLGASFRFAVDSEDWRMAPDPSADNPKGLDERTITGVSLYEFGPVTFPAYSDATAGLRSGTDTFIDRFLNDELFLKRFISRSGPAVVERIRAALPPTAGARKAAKTPTASMVAIAIPMGRNGTTSTVTINVPRERKADIVAALERYQTTTKTADGGEEWDEAVKRRQWVASRIHVLS